MNWFRKRTARVVLAIGVGLTGGAAAVAASAGPAWAVTGSLCESFGPQNCAGTDNFSLGTLIEERNPPGRTIEYTGTLSQTGVLKLTGATNRCFRAVSNDDLLEVGHCSGDTGIVFTMLDAGSGHRWFVNNFKTNQNGHNEYLTGCGTVGGAVAVNPFGGIGGCDLQKWDLG